MSKVNEKTVQDWVNFLGQPAWCYHNKLINKYMYFIVMAEYDSVAIYKKFDKNSYSKVYKDWECIFNMSDYISDPITLSGIDEILVLPFKYDTKPAMVVYPEVDLSNTEDEDEDEEEVTASDGTTTTTTAESTSSDSTTES